MILTHSLLNFNCIEPSNSRPESSIWSLLQQLAANDGLSKSLKTNGLAALRLRQAWHLSATDASGWTRKRGLQGRVREHCGGQDIKPSVEQESIRQNARCGMADRLWHNQKPDRQAASKMSEPRQFWQMRVKSGTCTGFAAAETPWPDLPYLVAVVTMLTKS